MTERREDAEGKRELVCYEYDEQSVRLWFDNHDVWEYTAADVGAFALSEMKRFADLGHGLMRYIEHSKAICNARPRKWKEWLGRG